MSSQHWLYLAIRRLSLAVCGLLLVWPQAATAYPVATISRAVSLPSQHAPQGAADGVSTITLPHPPPDAMPVSADTRIAQLPLPAAPSALSLMPQTNGIIAAGGFHACALTTGGGVKCWGYNLYGQLGDGTTTQRTTPVDVTGLTSGVSAISAGGEHSCALTTGGGVKCWGWNFYGQLGNGTTIQRTTPVDVTGLTSGVSAIAAGGLHTCALTTKGGVKCWGWNYYGQLGDGTITNRLSAVDVVGLTSGVSAIAVGSRHSCALTTVGGIKCWGYDGLGQLGDGTTIYDRLTAVDVVGLTSGVLAIAAGYQHSCALTTVGGIKCWGWNAYGQLGDGTTTLSATAVDVVDLTSGVSVVTAGYYHTCALTGAGGVKCWGYNYEGELGDGTTTQRASAVDVTGLTTGVSVVAAGGYHTCALTSTGGVRCWGNNSSGQLGNGVILFQVTSVDVVGLTSGVSTVAAGGYHTCALTSAGGVRCWGYNYDGELGDGTTMQRATAVDVAGLTSGVSAVATGEYHTCALTTAGGVKCWGRNYSGQLGDGTTNDHSTAVDVVGLTSGVRAIAAGDYHTCALTTGGGVKCWGYNYDGQLGDGTTTDRLTAVDVAGLTSGVSAITAGLYHTCALTTGGGLKCWGVNTYGQLGDGTTTNRLTAVDVAGQDSGVSAITAGFYHTCLLLTGGGVMCWGYNYFGQLGDGTTTQRNIAVGVVGITSGIGAIATGYYHSCVLTTDGGVKCWGRNYFGQLGDGTTTDRITPVDVVGLTSGVSAIAAGYGHTCGQTTGGGLKCWGYNFYGEVGNGTAYFQVAPVGVVGLTSALCYTLTIAANPSGAGAITASPSGNCNGGAGYITSTPPVTVTLTATPTQGYRFSNWSGDVNSSSNPLTLTLTADRALTATFTIPLGSLDLSGPVTATTNSLYTITATVGPLTATQPISYVWQVTNQLLLTHTGGLSDTANFSFTLPGPQTITVTATNTVSAISATHMLTVYQPPVAAFTAVPVSGTVPLTVTFSNLSSGDFTQSLWSFGDGQTSTLTNPVHVYDTPGTYTVMLTISGPAGSASLTQTGYIVAKQEYWLYLPVIER